LLKDHKDKDRYAIAGKIQPSLMLMNSNNSKKFNAEL
jgi:hypothetical protein